METETSLVVLPTAIALLMYSTVGATFASAIVRSRRRFSPTAAGAMPSRAPRVSILKPLAGIDDDLAENLESFAALDYPSFEILIGVASVTDGAYAMARAFVAEHPKLDARIVITDREVAINPKVAQLIGLDARATGDVVVISDSNVRVSPRYLMSLVRELGEPNVGLVTSLFAGTGERSVGAALENLQLGAVTAPGIVALAVLSKRPVTIGKSMAMWRRDLARLGGFRRVAQILAEDHVLGRVFLDAGYAVGTSFDVVENRNTDCTFARTVERHTRWAKIRRALYPVAFFFEPILSPLMTATLVVIAHPSKTAAWGVVIAALLQMAFAALSLRLLRGRALAWYYAPLELVRTYLVFACWLRACFSRRLSWRGHSFLVKRDTVIVPAPPSSWSRIRAAVGA